MPRLIEQINEEIKNAMKAKDAARLSALRLIKTDLMKMEVDQGKELSEADEMAVLKKMVKQRRDAIEQYRQGNRPELAEKEEGELKIIETFLPASLDEATIDKIIDEVLGEVDHAGPNATMGFLIGRVMGRLKATGRPFDGKAVNERVLKRIKV
ncbi:GatB/YqeY domain-containing protein [Candidatus Sumerlaeota bacterium]|nr:GatB/YqeY domain-containing protein [Candidatus Sumerlaeota bacterium]